MKKLVLASQKGGAGKTTLAAHLAVVAEAESAGPVVLIDTDPQGSLTAWWNSRKASAPVLATTSLAELPGKLDALAQADFKLAIIDTPPAMTQEIRKVIELADLVVIPVKPSPHDLRAVGQTVGLADDAGKPFVFAVNQAKGNARLTVQAVVALSAYGPVSPAIVHDRVDYAASMIDGRTTTEADTKGRGAAEIKELLSFIFSFLKYKNKTIKKETV